MARDEILITLPEDESEKLKSLGPDVGPLTSITPEEQITLSEDEIEKLKSLEEADPGPPKPLIQKVTQTLRLCYNDQEFKRYFKPTSVKIGPLNHEKDTGRDLTIQRGEKCKRQLATTFIDLSGSTTEFFYKNVKKEINSLKECYDRNEVEKWKDEELALMFLVDGCALLHFIVRVVTNGWQEFSDAYDLVTIEEVDFFLLENQLPYQLLEILIDSFTESEGLEADREELKKSFKETITEFINRSFLSLTAQEEHHIQVDHPQPDPPLEQQQEDEDPPHHLLDLLRRRLIKVKSKETGKEKVISKEGFRKTLQASDKSKHWYSIRNVKVMKDKGIRFKAREKGGAITDIDFNDRCSMPTLTLTPIFLHNTTMPMLLNLIAYELCPDFKENYEITSYLSFLDSLIDDGEDVKELIDAGVLHNGLASDSAVAELFNKISDILVSNLTMHSKLKSDIQEYCSKKSHFSSLRASVEGKLTHTYFRSPWSFFVFLGALAGLIMTGLQTYNSFHENKLDY